MEKQRSKLRKFRSLPYFTAIITLVSFCFTPASAGYRPTAGSVSGMVMYYGSMTGDRIIVGVHRVLNEGPVETNQCGYPGRRIRDMGLTPRATIISAPSWMNDGDGGPSACHRADRFL